MLLLLRFSAASSLFSSLFFAFDAATFVTLMILSWSFDAYLMSFSPDTRFFAIDYATPHFFFDTPSLDVSYFIAILHYFFAAAISFT